MSEVKTNKISSLASNNDITIAPNGTGVVNIGSDGASGGTAGEIAFGGVSGSIDGFRIHNTGGNYLEFRPSSTNAPMVLSNLGNVGVGTTSPTSPLHVSSSTTGNIANVVSTNSSYGNDVLQVRCARSGATTEYNNLTVFDNNTSLKMLIRANGNLLNSNNSYGSLSDQTLKENIVDSASQWDDIKAVQIRKYNFIDSDETQIGVVAQELEAAGMDKLVESVEMYSSNEEDEPVRNGEFKKSVKYSVLHMKALKALQEAMNRIETLEARLTELEAE